MSDVTLVCDSEGKPTRAKDGSYIFTKASVYFSLNNDQMIQITNLITQIQDSDSE